MYTSTKTQVDDQKCEMNFKYFRNITLHALGRVFQKTNIFS